MLNNKRGLSAVVLTVIMVGLVLVAVGIVWVVISGILTTQTEALDYNQKCLGLNFNVNIPVCEGTECNVTIERATGSTQDDIDGVEVTVSSESESDEKEDDRNIATVGTVRLTGIGFAEDVTKANVRVYFIKEDESKHYCSTIFSSE